MSAFLREAKEAVPADGGRYSRRLADKILSAFHHACDQNELEVADHLLKILEMMLNRRSPQIDLGRRRSIETLVAAHERLWHLRHPETGRS